MRHLESRDRDHLASNGRGTASHGIHCRAENRYETRRLALERHPKTTAMPYLDGAALPWAAMTVRPPPGLFFPVEEVRRIKHPMVWTVGPGCRQWVGSGLKIEASLLSQRNLAKEHYQ